MNNEIKNHTEQAKFRSLVDEILRMSPLTKKELYEVIQECYLESMRLEGDELMDAINYIGAKKHNSRRNNM